jgi:hypothetical protein
VTPGAWITSPPFVEAPPDRWVRIGWAAKQFNVDRAVLLGWAKNGTVKAKESPASGHWFVSEQSLKHHLFGSPNAGT